MNAIAYVYRNGRVRVGRKCPGAALPIVVAPERKLRQAVQSLATHGYKRGVYLVPELPLAQNDDEAVRIVESFRDRLKSRLGN